MVLDPFYIEVGRVAHELLDRYGWTAQSYAEKRETESRAAGDHEEARFWAAVAAHVTPRGN